MEYEGPQRAGQTAQATCPFELAHLGLFSLTVDRDETVFRETIRSQTDDDTRLDQFVLRRQGATASTALTREGLR